MRDRTDFVRMSSRWSVASAEGVAGYAEEERQTRCRQADENNREATSAARNVAWAVS
ncbi:hypothetical protein [Bacteroides heparinolyticus]|uniref:hypothetical protein n=1 Tax=Prevotella heparinolytica TaxID=28113 RepID=UPI0035A1343D